MFSDQQVLCSVQTKFTCKIAGYPNDTYAIQNDFHRALVNVTIPLPGDDSSQKYDMCNTYSYPAPVNYSDLAASDKDLASKATCKQWVHDKTEFEETFATQHGLLCSDSLKTSHSQMLFYVGVLAGDLGFGMLSDYIGRKKTFAITSVVLVASSVSAAFAPEFYSFLMLEFIVGASIHGLFMVCCVHGLELVGPSKRIWAGIVIHIFFAIGLVYLAGVGYLLRHWKWIQLAVAIPCSFYMLYWWFIPESPRWLISQGRYDEAEEILQRIAKVNKVETSERFVDEKTLDAPEGGQLWHLFTSKVLFFRTMILFFNWIVVSMVYYGVTMHAGKLSDSFFFGFFLMALVEFPAGAATIALLDRWGRQKLQCACMLTAGIACLCTIFPVLFGGDDLMPLTLTLSMIGKFGAAAAFGVIYVFSLELYPTIVRNGGMGASSCVARFGGMAAPYVAQSGQLVGGNFGLALPLVIFGGASVAAGLLALLLPETLERKLPETIEDAKNFGKLEKSPSKLTLGLNASTTSFTSLENFTKL
ncbi:Organic cation transporter protein [Mizuhopecten yessoensis]|uniref:Organic cation transporter protein n=1 Tax=Mizuhopecten yessoensis TaxID=6573 RepID=A0A210QE38_MIZYE|nr:Organic cation transporter protein [Mizuhopecten yessoensis]